MPAKGTSKLTEAKRKKIAVGKLQGKPSRVIAREVGITDQAVRRVATDQRTKALMLSLKEDPRNNKLICEGFHSGLKLMVATIAGKDMAKAEYGRREQIRAFREITNVAVAGEQKIEVVGTETGIFTYEQMVTALMDLSAAEGRITIKPNK